MCGRPAHAERTSDLVEVAPLYHAQHDGEPLAGRQPPEVLMPERLGDVLMDDAGAVRGAHQLLVGNADDPWGIGAPTLRGGAIDVALDRSGEAMKEVANEAAARLPPRRQVRQDDPDLLRHVLVAG